MAKKKKKPFSRYQKQPVFWAVKKILRVFVKKPKKVVNLAGELCPRSIIASNHSAKKGPLYLEMFFPIKHCLWGAGEMLGNYKSRWNYLRNVFYMQKLGFGKFRATFLATFEAIFSPLIYKGLRVLPTFTDNRLISTIGTSIETLKNDLAVCIFPENSNDGYLDVMTQFYPGFVVLAQAYFNKTGQDVPIYPVYYHIKKRILCIGEACYVQEYVKQGLDRNQIAELIRQKVNDLYFTYCADEPKKDK